MATQAIWRPIVGSWRCSATHNHVPPTISVVASIQRALVCIDDATSRSVISSVSIGRWVSYCETSVVVGVHSATIAATWCA